MKIGLRRASQDRHPDAEPARRTAVSHEDVFLARYDARHRIALRVAHGDTYEAEDLVREAFMRFTLVRPAQISVNHPGDTRRCAPS